VTAIKFDENAVVACQVSRLLNFEIVERGGDEEKLTGLLLAVGSSNDHYLLGLFLRGLSACRRRRITDQKG
jgi:hypothetical protein